MGELRDIPFEEESPEVSDRVRTYWNKRAESFAKLRDAELQSGKAQRWLSEITENMGRAVPDPAAYRILDAGCGSGFFEVLLGSRGYAVTGIDLTEEMIRTAEEMLEKYGMDQTRVQVFRMDAENPDFPDGTFDMVLSRNLTWTLPHPIEAYGAWYRKLKSGGVLLNFDAEYAKDAHNLSLPENRAHSMISDALKEECHSIYHMLTISNLDRPAWDVEILKRTGFTDIRTDPTVTERIYKEMDAFHIPDRMFRIRAVKP